MSKQTIDILQRALERERIARKQAESILEDKSRQLYELSEELKKTNKVLEGDLSEKTLELQAIFNNSSLGIVLTQFGKIVEANKAFEELLGYTTQELRVLEVKSISVKEDYAESSMLMNKLNDGTLDKFSVNKRYVKKNNDIIWAKTNVAAIRDDDGRIIYQVALVEDITEDLKLKEERKELIKDLERKNKDLRDFAHIVSHDLKSPLRSMDTLINWLKEYYTDKNTTKFDNTYQMLLEKVSKMDHLIDGVLRYSSIDSAEQLKEDIQVKILIQDILEMLHIPQHIKIEVPQNLPVIVGDVYRIQQLFQNLIDNAIKSIDKSEGLIVVGFNETPTHWAFTISDNGKGISENYKGKIFEIFQSLNETEDSTGVGLSIVKKIVELYQGEVSFTSKIGDGTTFHFSLKK